MDASFFTASLITILVNLIYAVLAVVVGCWAFVLIDRRLFKNIDFVEEMKKGNSAAALFASTKLLFIAIIMAVALRG